MTDLKSHPGDAAFITISTGVAATETCGGELRALWACADAALNAAKRAGRNRVSAGTVGVAAAAATAAAVGTAAVGTARRHRGARPRRGGCVPAEPAAQVSQ